MKKICVETFSNNVHSAWQKVNKGSKDTAYPCAQEYAKIEHGLLTSVVNECISLWVRVCVCEKITNMLQWNKF